MVRNLVFALAAFAAFSPANAQNGVELTSAVFVESQSTQNGFKKVSRAGTLERGDKLVLLVEWTAPRGARPFTVSAKVPASLAFQRSGNDSLQVSADGGQNWGQLGSLRTAGGRLVSPEDVTHLRWTIPARLAASGNGRIAYSALVR